MTVQHPEADPGMEGTTTLREPTLEEQVEHLRSENARLLEMNQRADQNMVNLHNANQRLQQHLQGLGEALCEEAEHRGWCEEYDEFAEQWDLPKYTRGWAVTITLTVAARDEDTAIDFVKEHISLCDYADGVVSGPEFDVDEAQS